MLTSLFPVGWLHGSPTAVTPDGFKSTQGESASTIRGVYSQGWRPLRWHQDWNPARHPSESQWRSHRCRLLGCQSFLFLFWYTVVPFSIFIVMCHHDDKSVVIIGNIVVYSSVAFIITFICYLFLTLSLLLITINIINYY